MIYSNKAELKGEWKKEDNTCYIILTWRFINAQSSM